MTNHAKIWAVVPAAGTGARMMASIPKQYLPLAGKTVLHITLDKLQTLPNLAGCIVALAADDHWFTSIGRENLTNVITVIGGAERSASVFAALHYLIERGCAQDWALVHDAARPCVKPEHVQKLVREVLQSGCGGLLAAPVADTLKQVDQMHVQTTVDRRQLWQAHTPQMFRVGELFAALQMAQAENRTVTDESSAMEAMGVRPLIVADSRDNIKITQPEDLVLAEFILRQQMF